jgi:hypothetical protein
VEDQREWSRGQDSKEWLTEADAWTSRFVWGNWLAAFLAALFFVHQYGTNIPYWDEWGLVPFVTGTEPVTLDWLWQQHNEHRIPLPKLIEVLLIRSTGGDFRAGMVCTLVLLGATSANLIRAARTLRGKTSYADAVFPLALLHWGHDENFLWSFQVAFSLWTTIVCALLILLVRNRDSLASAVKIGICLLLLPLCGAQGVMMALPFATLLAFMAFQCWSQGTRSARLRALLMASFAVATFLLVAFYLVGYHAEAEHLPCPSFPAFVRTVLQTMSMAFGPGPVESFWPLSAGLGLTVMLTSLLLLAALVRSAPEWRNAVWGIGACLAGLLAMNMAIGYGRAFLGPTAGMSPRYALLSAPMLFALYFLGIAYKRTPAGRAVQIALLLAVVASAGLNYQHGQAYGRVAREGRNNLREALRAGASVSLIADRAGGILFPPGHESFLRESFEMLDKARVGPYRGVPTP